MKAHRQKQSFTAGELSPLMFNRADFDRYKNGCRTLLNMQCATQGPATRRSGFQFIYDLVSLGLDQTNPLVRMIPFTFSESQAFVMIFYMHTDGDARMVLGTGTGLVVYPGSPSTECPPGTPVSPAYTPGDIVTLTLPSGWGIETFDWAQSADEMYIAQTGLQPHIIQRHADDCWEVVAITFTDQPSDWSTPNGWPETVVFHQQRLLFASNTLRKQTVWCSKAGDFADFGVSSPLVDSDAITFTLDSGAQNKIRWILSGKALHVGTVGSEWSIVGNNQDALTPSNILAKSQTDNGSEAIKALRVGLTTLFVEKHGRTVNEFVYDFNVDSYKTSDMAILSPHITEDYSIIDWTYQQTPDNVIWCVREDGDLLGITYQREHKVIGWHHHTTVGAFKTLATIPGDTREDDVWTVVKRVINSSDRYFVEKMADRFNADDAEWGRFLDSYAVYQGVPVNTITGLAHLEGEEVTLLVDGATHPTRTVVSGEITLNNDYSHVVVGINFISEVWPLVTEITGTDGTSVGRVQRVINIEVDLYKSLGMEVGRYDRDDGESVEDIPFRRPSDDTGQEVPLFSGIVHLDYAEGYNREPIFFIRQSQPLPLTIRGITDIIEIED